MTAMRNGSVFYLTGTKKEISSAIKAIARTSDYVIMNIVIRQDDTTFEYHVQIEIRGSKYIDGGWNND